MPPTAPTIARFPIGVVLPRDADDVIATIALAREYGAPILCRGSGTSLAGQCCNVAVVLDFTKYMNQILEIDPERRIARVQPGVVLDHLRNAAEKHHLTFGPDPASHDRCTLGGMIGNNSCGVHSVMAGKTDDNIEALDVLTYDGLRMTVGKTSDAELEQIIRDGGRRGEIYAGLKDLRDQYSRPRPPEAIPTFRGGFRDTTSTSCCPKMVSMWPARWSGPKAPVSPCLRRRVAWCKALRRECCW